MQIKIAGITEDGTTWETVTTQPEHWLYIEDILIDQTPREGFLVSTMLNGYRVKKHYIDWDVPNAIDDFLSEHAIQIIQ